MTKRSTNEIEAMEHELQQLTKTLPKALRDILADLQTLEPGPERDKREGFLRRYGLDPSINPELLSDEAILEAVNAYLARRKHN